MYVYYLVAQLCATSIPAECQTIWQKGPYQNVQQCQREAAAIKEYKATCWFKPRKQK